MSDFPTAGVKLVAEGAPEFFGQLDQGNSALASFGQAASTAGDATSGFGRMLASAGAAVATFAVAAIGRGIRALEDFAAGSIDAAKTYQRTMSDIVGLTGTSEEAVAGLSDEVLKLPGDVAKSPQELAKSLYFILSSGVDATGAMEVLTVSAKAAAAGLGDTQKVADLATSVMNAYGQENMTAAQAVDILTTAVKDGKGEPEQYAAALGRVIPIASAAGVSFNEVAASISTMTLVGINVNESVTALRGIIGSLEKPSQQTSKALASIGLSADEVRASLREKGLLATMQDLWTRSNGNLDIMGRLIPNIRALGGVLATTATQGDKYAQILNDMANASGATEKAFRTATGTYDFQSKALKSTLEALQVELGQALLPMLTKGTAALVDFAQGLQGKIGPAVQAVLTAIGKVGDFLQKAFVPAVAGATTALLLYAAVNTATLLPALIEQIGMIAASTTAWLANAAAVLASLGPFIAIGAAIAAVGFAWNDFNQKNADATTQLLESRPWWNASTDAITSYGQAVGTAKEALTPYAATIQVLRDQIQGEITSLAKRDEAGLVSDAQRQQEMDHINQLKAALVQTTDGYNAQEQALLQTAAASMTGTAQMQALIAGEAGVMEQTQLTEKELETLEKQIKKTFEEGGKAVGAYVDTAVSFMAKWAQNSDEHTAKVAELYKAREKAKTDEEKAQIDQRIAAENKAYQTQQQNDAVAYAKQEAAQRAHLGQMLEDYTLEQVHLGNITAETADKILAEIEQQFGQVEDVSGRTFLAMTQDIDKASKDGGESLDHLGEKLGDTADDAVTTKQKMDDLAKQYTIEVLNNFDPTKDSLDDLRHRLEEIPRKITIEIEEKHYISGTGDHVSGGGVSGTRAGGGPVSSNVPYLVGEQGPEIVIPQQAGLVLPADVTAALLGGRATDAMLHFAMPGMTSPPSLRSGGRSGDVITIDQSRTITMPVTTNMTTAAIAQSLAISQAMIA